MDFVGHFEGCCIGAASSKIIERRRSIAKLRELLYNDKVVEYLDKGKSFTWDAAVQTIHAFLQKVKMLMVIKLSMKRTFYFALRRQKNSRKLIVRKV